MINSTTDYSKFEFNELNRGVDDAHVRRLTKNIKQNGLIQPIVVTADGNIIDGQHRFHACRELGIPVQYIIRDAMTMTDVVQLNNMSKPWSVMDKVQSYAAQGNENYVRLLEFHAECQEVDPRFSIRAASHLAQGSAAHSSSKHSKGLSLGGGTWEFKSSKEDALKRLYALSQFKRFSFYLNNNFVTAFLRCIRTVDGFNWKELLKKAEMNPHLFIHAGTTNEYMRMFETVYNHKKRSQTRFF